MIRRVLLGVVLCALALPAAEAFAAPGPGDAPPPPSVLLVVLDACRADRLSPYGFDRATTPALARVAEDPNAVVFQRHYVQAPWTKPSTASLFTGKRVSQHKVYRGHTAARERRAAKGFMTDRLSDDHVTLAERMKKAGLTTFGVVWGRQLEPEYGFAQGFDQYFTQEVKGDPARLERVLELAEAADGPFFGYVHFEGCHLPFPVRDRHPEYMKEHAIPYDEEARRAEGLDFGAGTLVFDINRRGRELTTQDAAFLDLTYQAKTRKMDEEIVSRLLEELEKRGLDEDLILLFTADHGEELYEHGKYGHSQGLWDEIIRVPLVVRFPEGRKPESLPKTVDAPTHAIGVLPALMHAVGLPPDPLLPGANLFAGETPDYAVSEMSPIWGRRGWAVIQDDHKLLHHSGGNQLTNIVEDPGERVNLAAKEARTTAVLSARALELKRHMSALQAASPMIDVDLDPKAIEQLRALGYME